MHTRARASAHTHTTHTYTRACAHTHARPRARAHTHTPGTRGNIVRIHGLSGAPELNGAFGEVESLSLGCDIALPDLPERIRVRVSGESEVKSIRPPQHQWAEPWAHVDSIADAGYDPTYRWEYAHEEKRER